MFKVEKGWGSEEIWADHKDYCGKFLHFHQGSKFSMHFHAVKHETWFVLVGSFKLEIIDTRTAERQEIILLPSDTYIVEPLIPHQLTCISGPGTIIEVSTYDDPDDSYRVEPGDSQK